MILFTTTYKMKATDLPWLVAIPEHWQLCRTKEIFYPVDIRSVDGSEEILTVSSTLGIVPRKFANVTMFEAASYEGYKLCWPGDLVINSLWAWAFALGVSQYHGVVSTAYGVYRLLPGVQVDLRFIHLLLRSVPFQWELQTRSKGIWISRLQLTDESFLDAPLPLPTLEEQVSIARYLDYSDQMLRGGGSQKQRLVELMEEYKGAVIQQAVTRGLDPDVPLKPSGIEWLGDIPEHWEVRRLKSVCRFSYGDSLSSEDRIEGSIPVFGSNGQVDFHISANTNGPCVVIGRKGSFGKVHYSEKPVFAIDTTFFVDSRFTDANLRYLGYLLGTLRLDSVSRDSAVPGLSREDAYQHVVAIPSFVEQNAIVAHLNKLTSDIDAAIAHTRREIELLEEYRTRLIADVVTGKLDVREAAANLPDVNPDDLQPLAEGDEAGD